MQRAKPSGSAEASTEREFAFGDGKISGALSAALGALGLGAVLCLIFPDRLTTPEMRALYPMSFIRALIHTSLVAAFGLGVLSILLGPRRRRFAWIGVGCSVAAVLLGGAEVPVDTPIESAHYLGLDWFVASLFFLALLFIPLERAFARRDQLVFRKGWKTDLAYFFTSHVLVQITVMVTMLPAAFFFRWAPGSGLQGAVASQPVALQFLEALFLADLFAYFSHRLFHAVPFLWRFHAIHHSSEQLDWLASSRLHLVDILITRAVAFVPLYVMGFSTQALHPYLVFASVQAIFIHANVRFDFGVLRYLLATPQFHHWHHTSQSEALDRNFAVHLPLIDWMFGTYHQPRGVWPERYGIEHSAVPPHFFGQLVAPFVRTSTASRRSTHSE